MARPSFRELIADALHRVYARLMPGRVRVNHPAGRHHRDNRGAVGVIPNTIYRRLAREAARPPLRTLVAVQRMPARTRFAGGATALRTAGREAAAVAVSTARRMGARHRHVPGTTDVHHDLVAQLVAYTHQRDKRRAFGEMSLFAKRPMRSLA